MPSTGRHLRSSKRRAAVYHEEPTLSNTRGLSCLADEIYLEILSHFPTFSIPAEDSETEDRRLALEALSRTCRSLRRVFLPYRWQRIEVYDRMDLGRGPLPSGWCRESRVVVVGKLYAMELLRQLETVTIRNPSLADCVNVLDIVVVNYSAKSMLPELARCISLMPNLHTVQISFDVSQGKLIEQSFFPYTYPQIRTASVTRNGCPFLESCPGVKFVHTLKAGWWDVPYFLEALIPTCSAIEKIGPLMILWTSDSPDYPNERMERYISPLAQFKNLRDVTLQFNTTPSDSDMRALWKVSSLRTIRLIIMDGTDREIEEWKARMDQWLSRTPELATGESKELIIAHD